MEILTQQIGFQITQNIMDASKLGVTVFRVCPYVPILKSSGFRCFKGKYQVVRIQ